MDERLVFWTFLVFFWPFVNISSSDDAPIDSLADFFFRLLRYVTLNVVIFLQSLITFFYRIIFSSTSNLSDREP